MSMADERPVSLSGLTEREAQEFHGVFMTSFIVFTIVAIVAHVLVWMWRPWLPGPEGYTDAFNNAVTAVTTMLT